MLAAYGVGIAKYQAHHLDGAIDSFDMFFKLKSELDVEGVEYGAPPLGMPLARFYYAHALFNTQRLEQSKAQLHAYFADVETAGPQRILNLPNSMLGREVSDVERAASRFKVRASSPEAQADGYTMLAMIAEREEGLDVAIDLQRKCIGLASGKQLADAHNQIARLYRALGNEEQQVCHQNIEAELRAKIVKDEKEAAEKAANESASNESSAVEAPLGDADQSADPS